MAGSDPWARVVWVVDRWSQVTQRFVWDSAWTDEAAAWARAMEVQGGCVAVPLDPTPAGDVIRPEIELWRAGGRGRRPGLVGPGDDAA